MSSTFNPPSVADVSMVGPQPQNGVDPLALRLMRHYAPMSRGLWVLKIDGVYATHDYPEVDVVNSADEVYQGGCVYTVSDATAAALTAAGYGENLT